MLILNGLSNMLANRLLTPQQFRDMRDQFALDGYRLRWPILDAKRSSLRQRIDAINMQLNSISEANGRRHLEEEKKPLTWEYQGVCGEIAAIETDAPIRKIRLGLIPIPPPIENKEMSTQGARV